MDILDCHCGKEPLILFPSPKDPYWSFVCKACDLMESDKDKERAIEKWNKIVRKEKIGALSFVTSIPTYERHVLARPVEEPEIRGWTVKETLGVGIVNPRASSRMIPNGRIIDSEPLTEEDRIQRKIMEKSW